MLKADRVLSTRSHCVKSVGIRSYSGPYFTKFGLNTERYGVYLRIQSECGKMQTRITPNTNTFYEFTKIVKNPISQIKPLVAAFVSR